MSYIDEMEQIRLDHGGILKPDAVVEFARDPNTALHERFQWDDDEAAHQYRLWQARELIQVVVTTTPTDKTPIRAYVSLRSDRTTGGGYRAMDDVMGDEALRAALMRQARSDMTRFRTKYRALEELAVVFDAMRDAAGSLTPVGAAAC